MADDLVQRALQLLQEAGRMDLIRGEALKTLHPARKASDGASAATWACSPLRRIRSAGAQKDIGESDGAPGGHGAARPPWVEEKAGHRQSGSHPQRMVQGHFGTQTLPGGCVTVEGCAPTGVAVSWGQPPGTSRGYGGLVAAPRTMSQDKESR
ncbi:hypothetical protein NDU88_003588 [Pleurodeles waltl]|uniref:Uncharacterized protein n=1 Tax=Pleurodeles waltl TaxID=8319 RepID=A0AAV7MR02_PLEWA|nr:hypothetical protein NDU88_003588 [Pleurodeles waltl]